MITQTINWHWIFFINLPIGLMTAFLATGSSPTRGGLGLRAGADIFGAALLTGGLMLGVYNILEVPERAGVRSDARARRRVAPCWPLRLPPGEDREPADAAAALPLAERRRRQRRPALLVAGMFGMFFLGALYMQKILGYDALQVGLAFLPATIVMGTMSIRLSERLIMRFGPRRTLLPGVALIGVGLLCSREPRCTAPTSPT